VYKKATAKNNSFNVYRSFYDFSLKINVSKCNIKI
jgi:hypothetical protein